MSDLISRKKAIEALGKRPEGKTDWDLGCRTQWDWDTEILRTMPAAESEEQTSKLSSAEKTGKWVKASGYASPGGDPVWKCSECGKGIHTYGIEANSYNSDYTDGHQWVACPNCGAKMITSN